MILTWEQFQKSWELALASVRAGSIATGEATSDFFDLFGRIGSFEELELGRFRQGSVALLLDVVSSTRTVDGETLRFLAEVARRLLAVGLVGPPTDLLLFADGKLDGNCLDEPLADARMLAAIELMRPDLMVEVAHRRALGDPSTFGAWLRRVVRDLEAQCLLVAGMVGRSVEAGRDLGAIVRGLEPGDDPGPIRAIAALRDLIAELGSTDAAGSLFDEVTRWPGWADDAAWPIRHPARDLAGLKARVTDLVADSLGRSTMKFWRAEFVDPDLLRAWSPLAGFCYSRSPMPTEARAMA